MSKRVPTLTEKQVIANFPKRPRDSHKGMFGTVAVIGGAGCVHIWLLADNAPSVDLLQPELMLHSASDLLRPNPLPRAGGEGRT